MTTISMPIHITVQEAEFLTSGALFELYLAALEKEELARQNSINRAIKRMRLADATTRLYGYEVTARIMHHSPY